MNDITHRTLPSAKVPSRVKPSGLHHSDGKCPDGVTMIPRRNGKLLVRDATSPDTIAPSYISKSYQWTRSSGCSGRGQEEDQIYMLGTNIHLHSNSHWDLRGVWPTDTTVFKGTWQLAQTGYWWWKPYTYLIQRLSVSVPRGNTSVLGPIGHWHFSTSF